MASKTATIQYRYLKTADLPPTANLQRMLVRSMRTDVSGTLFGHSAKLRIADIDQDGSFVLLNKITIPAHWDQKTFSGQLIHLQKGTDVAAVLQSLEEDAEEYLLEQVNLGNRASVVKGVLYFVTVDNHVGLLEGNAVRGRTLERYLTSIFQKHGHIEAGTPILLNSSFRAADGKRLEEAREITINAERNRNDGAGEYTAIDEQEAAKVRREGATVFDVLATLGWMPDAIERLKADIPADGWIEGAFNVFIKSKNRRKTISRATIDEALRNIDPSDLGLSGEGKEKNGFVKLSTQRKISVTGSLHDPSDAVEQIVNALRHWSETGKIDCTFDD